MSHTKTLLASAVVLMVVTGCSHAPLQAGYGTTTANNMKVQVINPNAGKTDVPVAALDGQKSEKLLKGYRTDSGKAATSTLIDVSK